MNLSEIIKKGKGLLEKIVRDYNLEGAVLINEEGLAVSSYFLRDIDEDAIAANGAAIFSAGTLTAKETGKGSIEQLTLKLYEGYVIFTKVDEGFILGVVTSKEVKLGVILVAIRDYIREILSL